MATAIGILDRTGPRGLTLRGLAAELGGGLGSIYWYVDGKDELLALACDALVAEALTQAEAAADTPADGPDCGASDPAHLAALAEIRRTAMAFFEQTQEHPWLALQLQLQGGDSPAGLRYWDRVGHQVAAMGLTVRQQFDGSTAIIGYVGGVAAEMAAQDLQADRTRPKEEQLAEVAAHWSAAEAGLTWLPTIADEFRHHDDRDQFLAGLDLLLSGLVRQAATAKAHTP